VKVGQPPGPKTVTGKGEIMPEYLVAIHHPDDFDPSVVTEAMERDINVLNEEMDAAGVRIFAGGLSAAGRSPMARCSSPTGHTSRPRST
jgi:hypothetical protein